MCRHGSARISVYQFHQRIISTYGTTLFMKKLRTAIIGTGFMGRVHAENLRRVPRVELAAVAGSSAGRAKKFGDSIGVDRTTGDYRELLEDSAIDAVHVLTPNALHYP